VDSLGRAWRSIAACVSPSAPRRTHARSRAAKSSTATTSRDLRPQDA